MGPLRLLLDHGIASDLWRQSASAQPSTRSCPSCAKIMSAVQAPGEDGAIDVELCRRCHMAWLDEEEWDLLPKRPRLPEGEEPVRQLPERAREVLARADADRIATNAPNLAFPGMTLTEWVFGLLRLPMRDGNRPVFVTPVAALISVVMVIATVAAMWGGVDEATARFGFDPDDPGRMAGLTLLTSFFLHTGVLHLLVNVYFLIVFGSEVERRLGSWRTAVVVAASIATSSLAHIGFGPDGPLVGAGGGIVALVAVFLLAFPHEQLTVFIVALPLVRWLRMPAVLAILYVAATGWGWTTMSHFGGAVAGLVFFGAWRSELHAAARVARVTRGRVVTG